MELIEAIAKAKDPADEVKITLITSPNDESADKHEKQVEFLEKIVLGAAVAGIAFGYRFDPTIHDRFNHHRHRLEDHSRPGPRLLPVLRERPVRSCGTASGLPTGKGFRGYLHSGRLIEAP